MANRTLYEYNKKSIVISINILKGSGIMQSFKLDMEITEATKVLNDLMNGSVSNVVSIDMGELSRVFSFVQNNNEFVVHFKNDRWSFDKARFIYDMYSSQSLPIPRVIKIGQLHNNMYYAISEKASGKPISLLVEDYNIEGILNNLASHFTYMSQLHIDPSKGFGTISPSGSTAQISWKATLSHFFDENEEGFHNNWTRLYKESFWRKIYFKLDSQPCWN